MKYNTMIGVEKVKDMETGGKHTGINDQIICNFNSGLGFELYGVNPLQEMRTPKTNNFKF